MFRSTQVHDILANSSLDAKDGDCIYVFDESYTPVSISFDIYNPNSVVSAVGDGKCKSYWSKTSSNEEVVRLINTDFDGIKKDVMNLIEGARVQLDCGNFQNDMDNAESKVIIIFTEKNYVLMNIDGVDLMPYCITDEEKEYYRQTFTGSETDENN